MVSAGLLTDILNEWIPWTNAVIHRWRDIMLTLQDEDRERRR